MASRIDVLSQTPCATGRVQERDCDLRGGSIRSFLVKGTKAVNSSSIILRGANDYMLDEMERALHDTLSVIKRTLESGAVVPGGGAVESALSIYLENFATTLVCRTCVVHPK